MTIKERLLGGNSIIITAIGRYSVDPHLGREDAASVLISTLLEQTGRHGDDYNFDELERCRQRLSEVEYELDALQTRFKQMNEKWRSFRRARYPDISDSEGSEVSDD
ncbi:hypothetical protein PIB30_074402 [Stylosanthes scabra]|uniref:Uncharacterized protein n=1 Tax=Stylosanthes scabra TaxID=79078 RepID=A0ABU6QQH3_9FABA|nr:hypothetical protein [Stylosanthes scabra]